MKKKNLILWAGAVALAAVLSVVGQQPQMPTPQSPSQKTESVIPQLPGTQPDIAPVDIQGRRRYLVGPGDVLDVRVFGQPDLSSIVEIDDEGNLSSLPFIDKPIPAMCRNEKEIQRILARAYSKYLRAPRVSVRVMDRKSRQPAVVYGAVRAPARLQMARRVRLHELLVAAGGITQGASGTIQIVHTERQMCPQDSMEIPDAAEYQDESQDTQYQRTSATLDSAGPNDDQPATKPSTSKAPTNSTSNRSADTQNDKQDPQQTSASREKTNQTNENAPDDSKSDIGKIEYYKVETVRNGFGTDDPWIRPGDIVIVAEGEPIYVLGGVMAPQATVMKEGLTLGRVIAQSGGLQKLAKSREINLYRQVKGKASPDKIVVDYDAIRNGKAQDILLQPYDIIDVRMQGTLSMENWKQMFIGIFKGGVGSIAGSLPYRVIY